MAFYFFSVKLCVVFHTIPVFPSIAKDGLRYLQSSSLIYQFKCRCEADYVGSAYLRLETRIGQHLPTYIRQGGAGNDNPLTQSVCESAKKTQELSLQF